MRKKKPAEHVNHERWLVSYADFITLLFAFFVVMFAVSQVDSRRLGRFTEAFSRAMGMGVFPTSGADLTPVPSNPSGAIHVPGEGSQDPDTGLPPELEGLRASLARATVLTGELQGLQIIRRRHELVLRMPDSVFFDSGQAALQPRALPMLQVIAQEIRMRNVDLRVEGHTDDRPIRTARYQSNWELSTARATAVLATLATSGILPQHLAAAGYGQFHPVAANDSDAGRQQNRRVDLVVGQATTEVESVDPVPTEAPSPPVAPTARAAHRSQPASANVNTVTGRQSSNI